MTSDVSREFLTAIESWRRRQLLPTSMSSADLEALSVQIRRASIFSAKVSDAQILNLLDSLIGKAISPERQAALGPGNYMNVSRFRTEIRNLLDSLDYKPPEGAEGGLRDLTSQARLDVIYKTNVEMQQGYGQFLQANDEAVIDAYPCKELFRLELRREPRPWADLWVRAGGRLFAGRMIARKDDPIWTKGIEDGGFNRFGNPFPPFDFNSGMWVKSVSRTESIALGVISAGDRVNPGADPGAAPQARVGEYSSDMQRSLLDQVGEGYEIRDGVLRRRG